MPSRGGRPDPQADLSGLGLGINPIATGSQAAILAFGGGVPQSVEEDLAAEFEREREALLAELEAVEQGPGFAPPDDLANLAAQFEQQDGGFL